MRLYAEMYDTDIYNIQSSLRKLRRKVHGNSLKTIKSVLKTHKKNCFYLRIALEYFKFCFYSSVSY